MITRLLCLFCLLILDVPSVFSDEQEDLARRSFAPLCPKHFLDEKLKLKGTWLESCDQKSIDQVRPYIPLIPRPYQADCYPCPECGGIDLNRYNSIEYPTGDEDSDFAFSKISNTHIKIISYGPDTGNGPDGRCRSPTSKESLHCQTLCWEGGYFRLWNHKYYPFFRHYLQYCSQNPVCDCYWPEHSWSAAMTNNTVYDLLKRLADNQLINQEFSEYWITRPIPIKFDGKLYWPTGAHSDNQNVDYHPNNHGMASSLVTYTFFYSQYHHVLIDVATFIDNNFVEEWASYALNNIYETLANIRDELLPLYDSCLYSHPHPKIYYERGLLKMHAGNNEEAFEDVMALMELAKSNRFKDQDILTSEMYLQEGSAYADLGMYDKAIASLTQAIDKDPSNKGAYFQRAVAYFETGSFDLALSDYLTSDKRKEISKIESKVSTEFRDALLSSMLKGSKDRVIDSIISLCTSGYQLTFYPIDSLTNFANSCYELTKTTMELIKESNLSPTNIPFGLAGILYEPSLKRLHEKFDGLSDAEKGALIGHAIGTYGVDIIAGGALVKGTSLGLKFNAACSSVREANKILTFEAMATSEANKEAIIAGAKELSAVRETVLQASKTSRIVVKTNNTKFHVMQEKHAWDKLITLTGNVGEDFIKVTLLLEDHGILSEKYILKSENFHQGKIIRTDYKMMIDGHEVRASFETYVETNQTFIKDAWVNTK